MDDQFSNFCDRVTGKLTISYFIKPKRSKKQFSHWSLQEGWSSFEFWCFCLGGWDYLIEGGHRNLSEKMTFGLSEEKGLAGKQLRKPVPQGRSSGYQGSEMGRHLECARSGGHLCSWVQ